MTGSDKVSGVLVKAYVLCNLVRCFKVLRDPSALEICVEDDSTTPGFSSTPVNLAAL